MAEIASVDSIAAKWARVTPQRTVDYEAGVKAPKRDWARTTVAAEAAWTAGVQDSITRKTWTKGVNRRGSAGWQEAAVVKGTTRWGPGVQVSVDAYQRGFAPYAEAIRGTTLPPRFARRDPRNLARVNAIVDALKKKKESIA